MKLIHLFCRTKPFRRATVLVPLASGLLLFSSGCVSWIGNPLPIPSHLPKDLAGEVPNSSWEPVVESGHERVLAPFRDAAIRSESTVVNPLRPRSVAAADVLPPIGASSPKTGATEVQQVAVDLAEDDRQFSSRAGLEIGLEHQDTLGVPSGVARTPVSFAPSIFDSTIGPVESTANTGDSGVEQLRLWGDPNTIPTEASSPENVASQRFSKSLFHHHRPYQALVLLPINEEPIASGLVSNGLPVRPIVTALPPQDAGSVAPGALSPGALSPGMPNAAAQESAFKQSNDELPEWWLARVADVQRQQAVLRQVGLSELIDLAVAQSPKIRMLQRRPSLAETEVESERSVFDPVLRLDTRYRDDADPVANQLQTGGPPVLKDNTWAATAGVQRRFETGTTADMFQRLGFKNSNSLFFSPQDQGTATVGLDINHPLLRNSGREFNRSLVVLAELQGQISFYEYQTELQREMVDIGTLYWQLLHARQVVLQTKRSRDRAKEVLDILTARANYDATANQVSAAKSDVSQRETELLDAQRSLREIEVLLRDKINDADFASDQDVELIPDEFFDEVFPQNFVALHEAIDRALANRWELQVENSRTQAADRQLYMSRCGLAPKLDLVLGVYSSGLAGDSGVEQAWSNQFGSATPGYYGGLEYEVPYGRRQAKAAVQRDQLQKQQALDAYQVARNEVITQVKTAHIRVETAVQTRRAAAQTVLDMRTALEHMQQRWEAAAFVEGNATQGTSPSIALEQLLTGQRRLQDAELRLASADLQLALTRQGLLLAMGEVLQTHVATGAPVELPSEPVSTETLPAGPLPAASALAPRWPSLSR